MRHTVPLLWLLILACLLGVACREDSDEAPESAVTGVAWPAQRLVRAGSRELARARWIRAAQAHAGPEYGFASVAGTAKTGRLASNPAQGFGVELSGSRLRFIPNEQGAPGGGHWSSGTHGATKPVELETLRAVTGARAVELEAGTPRVEGNRITVDRGHGLTEWFVNGPLGVEQGFTLQEPLSESELLRLEIAVGAGLTARQSAADHVSLVDAVQRPVLHVTDLVAVDALGRTLPARLVAESPGVAFEVELRGAAFPVEIDPVWFQQARLANPGVKRQSAQFGLAVALDGDTAAVAGPRDVSTATQGSVMLWTRSGGEWTLEEELHPPVGVGSQPNWGGSIALSGDALAVSAEYAGAGEGAVFMYGRDDGGWSLQQVLTGSTQSAWGHAVALQGTTLVVTTPYADRDDPCCLYRVGGAEVFERNGTAWQRTARIVPASANESYTGDSVAVDGDTIVLGATRDDTNGSDAGALYVFVRAGDSWIQQAKLTANDGTADEHLGGTVAVAGDTIVAGLPQDSDSGGNESGAAYVFVRESGTWHQQQKLVPADAAASNRFGTSVSLEGDRLVVGATGTANTGAAYVFERTGNAWAERESIVPPDTSGWEQVGSAVALSGSSLLVGASNDSDQSNGSGTAHLYVLGTGWTRQAELKPVDGAYYDLMGQAVAIAETRAAVGAPGDSVMGSNAGAVDTYALEDGVWRLDSTVYAPDAQANQRFGEVLAISESRLAVGVPNADSFAENGGEVHVFTRGSAGWTVQQTLRPSDPTANHQFGRAMALSGSTLAVGANGRVRVYTFDGSFWVLDSEVDVPPSGDCGFGAAIALDADVLAVGASCANGSNGAAYVYRRDGATGDWGAPEQVVADTLSLNSQFGAALAVIGDTLLVGAPSVLIAEHTDAGAAYVFHWDGTAWLQTNRIESSVPSESGHFGSSLGVGTSTFGSYLVIGDRTQDAVRVYRDAPTTTDISFELEQIVTAAGSPAHADFGGAVAVHGDALIAGAPRNSSPESYAGAAYVFSYATPFPTGSPCFSAASCASAHCVDGVCCDAACAGSCVGCTVALKGSGVDGECGFIAAGTDPDDDCTATAAASCSRTGTCDGAGACALWSAGTVCGSASCPTSTSESASDVCTGTGSCETGTTTQCMSGYLCAEGACRTDCAADSDCTPDFHCDVALGRCEPDFDAGSDCERTAQCSSGYCVGGKCCATDCTAGCWACSESVTGEPDGTCAPIVDGTDPNDDCAPSPFAECLQDGLCDGSGYCRPYKAAGTTCGSTTCVGGYVTGPTCDGYGTCNTNMVACYPFACADSIECAISCEGDANCDSGAWCNSEGTCQDDQANGASCTDASQCQSGQCVDGVCCNSACDDLCEACTAELKGGGENGECGAISAGRDPEEECTADDPASCLNDGTCDGARACRRYQHGTSCGVSSCSGNVVTGRLCSGMGTCVADPTGTDCGVYVCAAGSCRNPCSTDADCVAPNFCSVGSCVPRFALGVACTTDNDCASRHCVDGVCCDTTCQGLCQACSAETKASGGDSGLCGDALAGTDPHDTCPDDGVFSCDRNGECDGAGQCQVYSANVICAPPTCSGSANLGYRSTNFLCNGASGCEAEADESCGLYACGGNACATTCTGDEGCIATAFCLDGACVRRYDLGHSCAAASECGGGICVDGVCCDSACSGQCEACDGAGSVGHCSPVVGAPRGTRLACDAGTAAEPCQGRTCNGLVRDQCVGFVSGVQCRGPTCSDGLASASSVCDGSGSCPDSATTDCGAYSCDGNACGVACEESTDCTPGHRCDEGGHCVINDLADSCSVGADCASGNCADGVCCDTPCSGQCEACDVAGSAGRCVPVLGQPHGSRQPCGAGTDGDPCGAEVCDGSVRIECAGFVSGPSCRAASCNAGVATLEATCNGTGVCPPSQTSECGAYACAGAVCGEDCGGDTECAEGFRCERERCVAKEGASCSDEFTLMSPDGTRVNCSPYRCEGSACLTACRVSTDCAYDHFCDTEETMQCVPFDDKGRASTSGSGGDGSGCGCRIVRSKDDGGTLSVLGGLALVLGLRRRRTRPI